MAGHNRVEDPTMSLLSFDLERGQEAVFVTEDKRIGTWRAPYCGPTRLTVPTFTATRQELAALEEQLAARCPAGTLLHVHPRGAEDEEGVGTFGVWAAVTNSGPMLAGE